MNEINTLRPFLTTVPTAHLEQCAMAHPKGTVAHPSGGAVPTGGTMEKPHDVILAEMDWVVEFLTEQRAAAVIRGDDLTQWTGLPELVAEHKAYVDELHTALTDPGD